MIDTDALLDEAARAQFLGATLRAVRKKRGLRAVDVAASLGMPLRSYEHFEAGRGRITYERIERFAEATDSDAAAIVMAAALASPEFALRCADNKLMLILMLALRDFNDELGDDIAYLEPGTLIGGFTRLFGDLSAHARKRDVLAEAWLGERAPAGKRSLLGRALSWRRKGA